MTYLLLNMALLSLIGYLFGSISSAILVCKAMHLPDPRTQGSHNPGATNVLRIGGKKAACLTLVGDFLKGFLPIFIAKWIGMANHSLVCLALGAFIGHLFPIFFGFRGGKGVATALGCWFALSYATGLCWTITWLIMAILFHYSSLASLTASLLTSIYIHHFIGDFLITLMTIIMNVLLIYRHYNNINNLIKGKETRIGQQ